METMIYVVTMYVVFYFFDFKKVKLLGEKKEIIIYIFIMAIAFSVLLVKSIFPSIPSPIHLLQKLLDNIQGGV